jgi:hypothetical protein
MKYLKATLICALLNVPPLLGIVQLFNKGDSLGIVLVTCVVIAVNALMFS